MRPVFRGSAHWTRAARRRLGLRLDGGSAGGGAARALVEGEHSGEDEIEDHRQVKEDGPVLHD